MIPKVMKTVYCYLFPEVWGIMKAVEESVTLDMYRLSGREDILRTSLSKVFEDYPLNTTPLFENDVGFVDLDNHQKIIERITNKYSEIIYPLGDFKWVAPGAGSSPLIFHLLAYLKGKGYKEIHVLDGEYEGYGAYASHLGMEVHRHEHFSDFVCGGALWFISNPSTRDGNIIHDAEIKNLCDKGAKVVLDLSYAGSTRPHVYDVEHENIIAVLLSQSKPYGVFRFRMGGFLYTREEIPSLYANKWFKDPLRMLQSLKLVEDLGFHTLYKKYRPMQEEIIEVINSAYDLHITPSDALLLGYMTPLIADETLSPKERKLVEPYRRGPGWYRFCITPFLEEMVLVRRDCERNENIDKDAIDVEWIKLKQISTDTTYKSECPVCYSGMLLVFRNQETMQLEALDRCLFCGQVIRYTDIEDMRAMGHGKKPFPKRELGEQE